MKSSKSMESHLLDIAAAAIIQSGANNAELDSKEIRLILGLLLLSIGALGFLATKNATAWMLIADGVAVLGLSLASMQKCLSSAVRLRKHYRFLRRATRARNEVLWQTAALNLQKDLDRKGGALFKYKEVELSELQRLSDFLKGVSFGDAVTLLVG